MGRVEFASRLDDGGASPVQTVAVGTWTDPRSVERYIRVDKQTRKRTIALSSDTRENHHIADGNPESAVKSNI
ncbi:MAG: hypothetical protein JNM48_03395 [Rhodospirillales bacterium]|nr:hypothetical protein [Rhodospirillales bacterium]